MQATPGASLSASDQPAVPSRPGPRRRHLALVAGIAALGLTADQVTKSLAVEHLTDRPPVDLVGSVLRLYLTYNQGASFGMATGFTEVLTVISIGAVLVVLWLARRLRSLGWAIGLGFLLAGVLGNLTDRLLRAPGPFQGHVVDFLMLPDFPIFNLADICINIAAATIIVQAVRGVRVDGLRHDEVEQEPPARARRRVRRPVAGEDAPRP